MTAGLNPAIPLLFTILVRCLSGQPFAARTWSAEPLEFTVGSGQIIPGLDTAIPAWKSAIPEPSIIDSAEAYGDGEP